MEVFINDFNRNNTGGGNGIVHQFNAIDKAIQEKIEIHLLWKSD